MLLWYLYSLICITHAFDKLLFLYPDTNHVIFIQANFTQDLSLVKVQVVSEESSSLADEQEVYLSILALEDNTYLSTTSRLSSSGVAVFDKLQYLDPGDYTLTVFTDSIPPTQNITIHIPHSYRQLAGTPYVLNPSLSGQVQTNLIDGELVMTHYTSTSYTIKLTTTPTSPVTITITSSQAYLTVSPTSITLSDTSPQTVTITHVGSATRVTTMTYDVVLTHTTADSTYDDLSPFLITVTIVNDCDDGEYIADPASGSCSPCPEGYACLSAAFDKTACSPGEYSSAGESTCIPCPAGKSCAGAASPIDCAPGTYSLTGSSTCTSCTAGFSCDSTDNYPRECALGRYSAAGSDSCNDPSSGDIATLPKSSITTCAAGTYAWLNRCRTCPPGFSCPSTSDRQSMTHCTPGTYSGGGSQTCTACPAGHKCSLTADLGQCPTGYYADSSSGNCIQCDGFVACGTDGVGNTSCTYTMPTSTSCETCPEKHQCVKALAPLPCPSNQVSASGVMTCSTCTTGEYIDGNDCVACPAGHYCPNTVSPPLPCPQGTYSTGSATTCTECSSGYLCPYGSSLATVSSTAMSDYLCPIGFTCGSVSLAFQGVTSAMLPTPCAAGTYRESGSSSCIACPLNYYCPIGTYNYLLYPCPPGTQCTTTGLAVPTVCAAGSYNDVYKGTCKSCDEAGYFCPKGASKKHRCPPGYYCPAAVGISTPTACLGGTWSPIVKATLDTDCKTCPAGYYCPSGSAYPVPCPGGTFRDLTGGTSSSSCTSCTAGSSCPLPGMVQTHLCMEGYNCPVGTIFPNTNANTAGKLCDSTSLTSSSECTKNCPAGWVCVAGSSESRRPKVPCSPGYYCPTGTSSGTANPCPAGTYNNKYFLAAFSECSQCPAGFSCIEASVKPQKCARGHYCPVGTTSDTQYPCPAGTYSLRQDLADVTECKPCPKGYKCAQASLRPTICPTGKFNGDLRSSTCTDCPAGHYCPYKGMEAPIPCAPGYYSASGEISCTDCPEGRYCPNTATTTSQKTANICPAGLFCDLKTDHYPNNIHDRCPAGKYCTAGTTAPVNCPAGTLRKLPGAASTEDCESIEPGYYGTGTGLTSATICPVGKYCTGSTASPANCPAGTFRTIEGARKLADCASCPAGYACGAQTTDLSTELCPVGKYCTEGETNPQSCPAGTFGPDEGIYKAADCLPCLPGKACTTTGLPDPNTDCSAGYYCKQGASSATPAESDSGGPCKSWGYCPPSSTRTLPCPPGKYNDVASSTSSTACKTCPAKKFCVGDPDNPVQDCKAGFYCTGGAVNDSQNPASAGRYSGAGASNDIQCAVRTYQPAQGQSSCLTCPVGFYCDVTGMASPNLCTAGNYCPVDSQNPTACPVGTYSGFQGLQESADCVECIQGRACASTGMSDVGSACSAGWWCQEGAPSISNFSPAASTNYRKYGQCPAGFYCDDGKAPKPCKPGTYNPSTGSTASTACLPCTDGSYCEGFALTAVTGQCDPGYYCPAGQKIKNPIQYICPAGYYCVQGSTDKSPCAAGTYQPKQGQTSCLPCPKGYYCPTGTADFISNKCSEGHYCLVSSTTATANACPVGTFNPNLASFSIDACVSCTPGKYCPNTGMPAPSGLCDPGYVCPRGSTTKNLAANICAAGYYCPAGSIVQLPCTGGYYCSGAGVSTPIICSAGYYCISKATSATPSLGSTGGPCRAGYYCLSGSEAETPCPAGTIQPNTLQSESTACTSCTQGYFCNSIAMTGVDSNHECKAGWYCEAGSIIETPPGKYCVAGKKCPKGSSSMTTCAPGTYQPQIMQATCVTCPIGFYCSSADPTAKVICAKGRYCLSGTSSVDQYQCAAGTYNNQLGSKSNSACLSCPAGSYCGSAGLDLPTDECSAGYYCPGGASTATPIATICPRGSYCLAGSAAPRSCDPGYYCPDQGQSSSTLQCSAGYVCIPGSQTATPTNLATQKGEICKAGYYCPIGSFTHTPCPIGTYNALTGRTQLSDCISCDDGKYCEMLAATSVSGDCEEGFYCPGGNVTPRPSDYICPVGQYCPTGSSGPIDCAPGTYNPIRGQAECWVCPAGFTCAGSTADPEQCERGYKCPGGNTPDDMIPCAEGTYNPYYGQSECTSCPIGFECPEGSISASPCPAGKYCPGGNSRAIVCPDGTYTDNTKMQREDNCMQCLLGNYCTSGAVQAKCIKGFFCEAGSDVENPDGSTNNGKGYPCPIGHYCLEGSLVPTPCPLGKFTLTEGSDEVTDCEICTEGYYCIPGDPTPYECPRGSYCPAGTQFPKNCPMYTYSSTYMAISATTCQTCPAGYVCDDTGIGDYTRFPCKPGHYCTKGAKLPVMCPAGTWSTIHNSSSCSPCPTGSTCDIGANINTPCEHWEWCPEGSSSPGKCPGGKYCHHEQTSLEPCPSGFYCPEYDENLDKYPPFTCPGGYYCPRGTANPLECPSGYVYLDPSPRRYLNEGCAICTGGYYSESLSEVCSLCYAGYVCPQGASKPNPQSYEEDGGYPCPPGYYCLEGTAEPYACPRGTYNKKTGATSTSDCIPCEFDSYNDQEGQAGCFPCGPNARAVKGQLTCTCIGQNRTYMKRDGTCRCTPFYKFFKDGTTESYEDSSEDCVETTLPECAEGEVWDPMGRCRGEDDCKEECRGGNGKRDLDKGICVCQNQYALDDVCDSDCKKNTPKVTLQSDGTFIYTRASGVKTEIDLQSTSGYTGRVYCITGYDCKVQTINLKSDSTFTTNYQPEPFNRVLPESGRRLQDESESLYLVNPIVCLNEGDTLIFSIDEAGHYPRYLKDSLLNSDPSFDYGPFLELEQVIEDGKQEVSTFGYTFLNSGTFTFADKDDDYNFFIVRVVPAGEDCKGDAIGERWSGGMSKTSVKQEDVETETNWLYFIMLVIFAVSFMLFLVLVSIYSKKLRREEQKQRLHAFKDMLEKNNVVQKIELSEYLGGQIGQKNQITFLNPETFHNIYNSLLDNINILTNKLEEKGKLEKDQYQNLLEMAKTLQDAIRNAMDPSKNAANVAEKVKESMKATVPEIKAMGETEKIVHEISQDKNLTDEQKRELLSELDSNVAKLEAQLAENRVNAENILKKRLDDRNKRRQQLLDKQKQLMKEESAARDEVTREIRDAENSVEDIDKEFEHEKKKIREKFLGNSAKTLYRDMREAIKIHPEREQELKAEYERQMQNLENALSEGNKKQQQDLMKRLEDRRNARKNLAKERVQAAKDNQNEISAKLAVVNQKLDILAGFESNDLSDFESLPDIELDPSEEKQIQKFDDLSNKAELEYEAKKHEIDLAKNKLARNLPKVTNPQERDSIISQLRAMEDDIERLNQEKEARQKRLLEERLAERRRLRQQKKQKLENETASERQEAEKKKSQSLSDERMRRIEQFISALEPDQRLESVKELLADKHDQEVTELQQKHQMKSMKLYTQHMKEDIDIKQSALKAVTSHLFDLSPSEQQQQVAAIVLDAQNQSQREFERKWEEHQRKAYDDLLQLLDKQMKEVADTLRRLELDKGVGNRAQELESEFEKRKADMEAETQQRFEDLERQSEELSRMTREKQAALEREIETSRKRAEIEKAKRGLEARQRREREEMERKGILNEQQMEELLSQHQKELDKLENALNKEKSRQQQAMREKLAAKREAISQKMQLPPELMSWQRSHIEQLKKWKSSTKGLDVNLVLHEDLISELLRRVLRIEQIVMNVDTRQMETVMEALEKLARQLRQLKAR
jgi:hypothetical protein